MIDMRKVLVCRVGEAPRVEVIDTSLEAMQAIVGGYIESVHLHDGVHLICNEDGWSLGLKPNRTVGPHVVVGDFFLCRYDDEGDTDSMTPGDVAKWSALLL